MLDTCSLDIHANVNEDTVVDMHLAGEGEQARSDTAKAMTNTVLTADINICMSYLPTRLASTTTIQRWPLALHD